jgi:hypothetical protein
MTELVNIYCDESCHLQKDTSPVMVLGAVWCPAKKTREVADRLREIKKDHDISLHREVKWTKVSPSKLKFYLAVLNYFFDDDDLHFRGVVIPDKTKLPKDDSRSSHDECYFEICFTLLEPIIDPTKAHCVYLDIKDTRSETKRANLERVLRESREDHSGSIIRRVQQIRSHESELLQLADLLIGAVGYANRGLETSAAKQNLISRIRTRSRKKLTGSTWMREEKFNLFFWRPKGGQA